MRCAGTVGLLLAYLLTGQPVRAGEVEDAMAQLKHDDPDQRAKAARTLGQLADARALEPLLAALKDRGPGVRFMVAWALGRVGDLRASTALENTLRDGDANVRLAAAWAIGKLGRRKAEDQDRRRQAQRVAKPLDYTCDFEDVDEGEYPASKGWRNLREGKSAQVSAKVAHGGRRAFRLEGGERRARCDYFPLRQVPEGMTYEVAVLPAPAPGKRMRVGFVEEVGGTCRFYNTFQLTGGEDGGGTIVFRGNLKAPPVRLGRFSAGRWVTLKARLDFEMRTADLWVNGKRAATKVPIQPATFRSRRPRRAVKLSKWGVAQPKPGGATYIDDVRISGGMAPRSEAERAEVLARLIVQLQHDDRRQRLRAVSKLMKLGDARVVAPLIAAAGDADEDVRCAAVRALAIVGDMRAVGAFEKALHDSDLNVQMAAVEALGEIEDPQVLEPLITALRICDDLVQEQAACALGNLGDPRAIEPLVGALKKPGLSSDAAMALAKIGPPALAPLVTALRAKEKIVRRGAVEALGRLGWQPTTATARAYCLVARQKWSAAAELGRAAVEPFLNALRDADGDVVRAAALALGRLGDRRAVEPLSAVLKDQRALARWSAASALGDLGDARAVAPLLALLNDASPVVQGHAARALGKLGDKRAIELLRGLLAAESEFVRDAAVWALAQLGAPPPKETIKVGHLLARGNVDDVVQLGAVAVEPVIAALRSEDKRTRGNAVLALGRLRDKRAVEPLLAVLQDKDKIVRGAAVRALGRLGDRRAVEPLLAVLQDKAVRDAAVEALGRLGDRRAVEPLLAAWEAWEEEPGRQKRVVMALARLGGPRTTEALLAALEVRSRRFDAAAGLAYMGHPRGLEVLVRALKDPDVEVRLAAMGRLIVLGEKGAVGPLLAALKDQDHRVREGAAAALGQIGDKRVVPVLVVALRDQVFTVREAVAATLEHLGWQPTTEAERAWYLVAKWQLGEAVKLGAPAVEPLVAVLNAEAKQLRFYAAMALGAIGPAAKAAIPALTKALEDEDGLVRVAAAEALKRIQVEDDSR